MMKKFLFVALLSLFPLGASAKCDLSVNNFTTISNGYLDGLYAKYPVGIHKPRLIVSDKNVKTYYGEELHNVITIYPKSFNDAYCDQYFDGLTPFVAEVIDHEYTHAIDEKISLSKKIGESWMSENTAHIGEHVFDDLLWHTGYAAKSLGESDQSKYNKFMRIVQGA